jgi:L,D-transpeptidase YcbB
MEWGPIGPARRADPQPFRPARPLRRAGAVLLLLATGALVACGTDSDFDSEFFQQPMQRQVQADTELRARLNSAPELVVAGEKLDVTLLDRFYARHDYEPVWPDRAEQAKSVTDAVLRAGDQGLDPDLFHGRQLRHIAALAPLDRELLLTDAALSYADALARGAVPVERRRDDQVLTPEPVDVAAALDAAMDSGDAGAAIEALAPTTPTYLALRDALHQARSGPVAKGPPAKGDKLAATRLETIAVNLERQRWLPRELPGDRAWVNVADENLVLYRAGQPVFTTRVVVGEDVRQNQSPEFHATIDASLYNPPWVIPKDIVEAEILPKVARDPDYLAHNHMVMLPGGEAEQLPGPEAGLGYIMFLMPNKFDVYLHDTPDRYIFARDNRRLSHGCIRVQNPREFAAMLLDQPVDAIDAGIAKGGTTRHDLPSPVPVFVVYETAFVDTDGALQFRPDFYHRDAEIWHALQTRSPRHDPVVQADSRSGPPRVTGPRSPA